MVAWCDAPHTAPVLDSWMKPPSPPLEIGCYHPSRHQTPPCDFVVYHKNLASPGRTGCAVCSSPRTARRTTVGQEGATWTMTLSQGDPRLLAGEVARRLLASAMPARLAYIATDGTPRVVPTWFHWTGQELVMPTFVSAPHVRHPVGRLRALRANPAVAITIDTDSFPPEVLLVRGQARIDEADGVDPDYASAARRYLGQAQAESYLAQIDRPGTRMARIAVRPNWVGVIDFQTRLPSALGGVGPQPNGGQDGRT
jgi:Pyridoxamine 5'-phosphate oxidase